MLYGYNDTTHCSIGNVHLFADKDMFEARKPLCGRHQHYLPASESEGPKCKICERIAAHQVGLKRGEGEYDG